MAKDSEVHVCSVVIGELYYGAYKSSRKKENIEKLEEFIVSTSVLEADITTAKEYGAIKDELRRKGGPVPENDIWIAAFAKQYNLTLYTSDSHFKAIPGINAIIRTV